MGFILNIHNEIEPDIVFSEVSRKINVVSLKTFKTLTGKFQEGLEDISDYFVDYLMFDAATDSSEYTFQFFVEITFYKNTKPPFKHTLTISSSLFRYDIDKHPMYISVICMDGENHHPSK